MHRYLRKMKDFDSLKSNIQNVFDLREQYIADFVTVSSSFDLSSFAEKVPKLINILTRLNAKLVALYKK